MAAEPSAPLGDVGRGERIYHLGQLADGAPVLALREGVGALPPAAAACVSCHRPSGRGGAEGGILAPPIAAPALFSPGRPPIDHPRLRRQWLRHQQRSAYDDATLARALSAGIDPDGQPLGAVMPRYRLSTQSQADLAAYLHRLGSVPSPGLRQGVLHLATVFTPDAPLQRRATVREAMRRWSDGLSFGPVAVRWHAWTLQGPRATWGRQLEALAQRQPVFALVSGAGGADWAPVDDWCEARRLPCLFPSVDDVPDRPARHWAMHLSAGTTGETGMLVQRLAASPREPVLQVCDGPAGTAAAARLQSLLAAAGVTVRTLAGSAAAVPPPASADGPQTVVLWLPAAQATAWLARHPPAAGAQLLLLSAQLAPPAQVVVPSAWRGRVLWASQRADPLRQQAGAALSLLPWSQRLGLQLPADSPDLADVHAATFFFADALAQSRGVYDGEWLLERLEVAVDRRPAGAGYFRLSLGPGQRVAAQGGHFLAYAPPALTQLQPLPGYLRAAP